MSLLGNCVPLLGNVFLLDLANQEPWLLVTEAGPDLVLPICFLFVGGESLSETQQYYNLVG